MMEKKRKKEIYILRCLVNLNYDIQLFPKNIPPRRINTKIIDAIKILKSILIYIFLFFTS